MKPTLDRAAASRWLTLSLIAAILGAGILVYANSLTGPFIFDDSDAIVENPGIRRPSHLVPLLTGSSSMILNHRPVVSFSLAANYALHGLRVRGYHLFNLTVHLLAALTLFGIVGRTLTGQHLREHLGPAAPWIAFVSALVWVVHPLQTETVDYVTQRTELLMGLFYLLTLYCAIRGFDSKRRVAWYAAAVGCCALGMGSKEVMVSAPLMVLLYDRTFVSPSWGQALRQHKGVYAGLVATWGMLGGLILIGQRNPTVGLDLPITAMDYLKTQAGVLLHYLRLGVWPSGLVISYDDWPVARTAGDFVAPGLVIVVLLAGTLWGLWRSSPIGFLGGWFFLILAPTSSVLPMGAEIAAERRMYLPLAAAVVLVVTGGYQLLVWMCARTAAHDATRWRACSGALGITVGIAVLAAILLGRATIRRNRDYRSSETIWADAVARRPANAFAHCELALSLTQAHRSDEAFEHFREALRLKPSDPLAHNGLGAWLFEHARLDEALHECSEALRLRPEFPEAHNNAGLVLASEGRLDEAVEHWTEAIRLKPHYPGAHNNLGLTLLGQNRLDEAIEHCGEALRLQPDFAEAHYNLGVALARKGRLNEAVEQWNETLRLKPAFAQAHYSLARAAGMQGRRDEALRHYTEALRLDPGCFEAHRDLGTMLGKEGKIPEAVEHLTHALQLRPASPDVHSNLGTALAEQGKLDEAIDHYRKALQISPDLGAPHEGLGEVLERQGKAEEAIREYREASRLDPQDAEARERLHRILATQSSKPL